MIRKTIYLTFLAQFILVSCQQQNQETVNKGQTEISHSKKQNVYYYTCPMVEHKHVHNDKPGECPECRMELVAAIAVSGDSIEYYGCPMLSHSNIRHNRSGKCDLCDMDLLPMRLTSN